MWYGDRRRDNQRQWSQQTKIRRIRFWRWHIHPSHTTFEGAETGVLQANGGSRSASSGGAGGGGRIVVWYGQIDEVAASKILDGEYADLGNRFVATTSLPTFVGTATVAQGTGDPYQGQEYGTVYFVTVLPPLGTLIMIQ